MSGTVQGFQPVSLWPASVVIDLGLVCPMSLRIFAVISVKCGVAAESVNRTTQVNAAASKPTQKYYYFE